MSLTSGGNGVQRSFLFTPYLAYNRINHSEKGKLFDIFIIIYLFFLFIYFVFQAVDQGRIYALRYELCDGLARSPDLTDKDPRREMWNFFSPIALFASKPISQGKNELVPVAIQMDFTPGMYEPFFY